MSLPSVIVIYDEFLSQLSVNWSGQLSIKFCLLDHPCSHKEPLFLLHFTIFSEAFFCHPGYCFLSPLKESCGLRPIVSRWFSTCCKPTCCFLVISWYQCLRVNLVSYTFLLSFSLFCPQLLWAFSQFFYVWFNLV